MANNWRISRRIGFFTLDSRLMGWLIVAALALAGWLWLQANPQHNPFAALDTRDPPGLATHLKLTGLVDDPRACRSVLEASDVSFTALPPTGEGPCARVDRTLLSNWPLRPDRPETTCAVATGLDIWLNNGLQQAAEAHLGARVTGIDHLGAFSCRRVNGSVAGPWSEHASANAIDIRGFTLSDGRTVSVLQDWDKGAKGAFLAAARTAACESFMTVLSPDYNAAHADHFHLDQGTRWSRVCR